MPGRSTWFVGDAEPSDEELERAKLCLLDWLGCAIAGMPAALELLDGTGIGAEPAGRALVHGVAGHLLDYDDTLPGALTHPSAVLWPSLLAIGFGGGDLLRGFLHGVEAQDLWGREHANAIADHFGHPTAALGAVAAALAIGRIMGSSESRIWQSVRMAGAVASGSQSVFGTAGKSIQVGYAARSAVETSLLGWGDPPALGDEGDPLLVRGGLVDRMTRAGARGHGIGAEAAPRNQPPAGEHPVHRIVHKFHASCYATHGALDAFRDLGIPRERISSASVTIGDDFPAVATAPLTADGLGAKFSMKACLALAASGYDTADPAVFESGPLSDPRVREFGSRIACSTDTAIPSGGGAVALQLADGGIVRAYADPSSVEFAPGERRSRVEAKFRRLVDPVVGAGAAGRISIGVLERFAHAGTDEISLLLEEGGLLLRTPERRR